MTKARIAAAAVLAVVGVVWLGQGIGLIQGSIMTGEPFWAAAGIACLVAALLLVLRRR